MGLGPCVMGCLRGKVSEEEELTHEVCWKKQLYVATLLCACCLTMFFAGWSETESVACRVQKLVNDLSRAACL